MEDWGKIVTAVVGVLGSASIWRFFEKRIISNNWSKKFETENSDTVQFRKELQNRVKTLEDKLVQTEKENKDLRDKFLELSMKYQNISVTLEFIQKENKKLHDYIAVVEKENQILKTK